MGQASRGRTCSSQVSWANLTVSTLCFRFHQKVVATVLVTIYGTDWRSVLKWVEVFVEAVLRSLLGLAVLKARERQQFLMYVSPGFGRGQPAYLYWSTALSLLLSGQSGCLTHVLASISAFPSAPGFAALPCNLSLKTSLTALYVSILSVSPEAIFPYRLPRGSSCIQISMQCPPGYCGTLGKSVLKGASHMLASGKTLWVLGLHWRAASGQPHGDFLLVEVQEWHCGHWNALENSSWQPPVYWIPGGIMWKIAWYWSFTSNILSLVTWVLGVRCCQHAKVPWVLTGCRDSLPLES